MALDYRSRVPDDNKFVSVFILIHNRNLNQPRKEIMIKTKIKIKTLPAPALNSIDKTTVEIDHADHTSITCYLSCVRRAPLGLPSQRGRGATRAAGLAGTDSGRLRHDRSRTRSHPFRSSDEKCEVDHRRHETDDHLLPTGPG